MVQNNLRCKIYADTLIWTSKHIKGGISSNIHTEHSISIEYRYDFYKVQ